MAICSLVAAQNLPLRDGGIRGESWDWDGLRAGAVQHVPGFSMKVPETVILFLGVDKAVGEEYGRQGVREQAIGVGAKVAIELGTMRQWVQMRCGHEKWQ